MVPDAQRLGGEYILETFSGRSNSLLLDEIARLRVRVWRATGFEMSPDFPADSLHEALDGDSLHYAIMDCDAGLVAASRLTICPSEDELPYPEWFRGLTERPKFPVAYIARLVVDPGHQGKGLGYYLDTVCIQAAKDLRASSVLCDIPDYRLDGLTRRGFRIVLPPTQGVVFPSVYFIGMLLDL